MNQQVIDFMLNRRSVLAKNMTEPGPNSKQLDLILNIAARVPDHRKLEPWRFIVIEGDQRLNLGKRLAKIKCSNQQELTIEQITAEQKCFMRAPLVIAVIFSPVEHKTPKVEQLLSTGAVCQNINIAAAGLGFVSQWITGWSCDDKKAHNVLKLDDHESIAGYLYIGSSDDKPADRQRPDIQEKTTWFKAD